MTSTNIHQGLADGKPSSKVLAPPGGQSNIFMGGDEPAQATRKPAAPISNVFGDGGNENTPSKSRPQENTSNRLFGGPDDDKQSSGKAKGQYHPSHNYKGEDWAKYDHPNDEEDEEKDKDNEKNKGRNPITGEEYDKTPEQQPEMPQRKRQPPGGFSSGIFG